eukprot:73510_1
MDFSSLIVNDQFLTVSLKQQDYPTTLTLIYGYIHLHSTETFPTDLVMFIFDFYVDAFLPHFNSLSKIGTRMKYYCPMSKTFELKDINIDYDTNKPLRFVIDKLNYRSGWQSPEKSISFGSIQHIIAGYYKPLFERFDIAKVNIRDENKYFSVLGGSISASCIFELETEMMAHFWVKGLRLLLKQKHCKKTNEDAKQWFDGLMLLF